MYIPVGQRAISLSAILCFSDISLFLEVRWCPVYTFFSWQVDPVALDDILLSDLLLLCKERNVRLGFGMVFRATACVLLFGETG